MSSECLCATFTRLRRWIKRLPLPFTSEPRSRLWQSRQCQHYGQGEDWFHVPQCYVHQRRRSEMHVRSRWSPPLLNVLLGAYFRDHLEVWSKQCSWQEVVHWHAEVVYPVLADTSRNNSSFVQSNKDRESTQKKWSLASFDAKGEIVGSIRLRHGLGP